MQSEVAVLLYPGCIFFEIALATETLAAHFPVRYYTPDGRSHNASNAATVAAAGNFTDLEHASPIAVLVPGGDPGSILAPANAARQALQAAASRDAVLAGICAGTLVLAASGLLKGRRGTHNYTTEHTPLEHVRATAPYWEGMVFERANLVQDGRLITAQPWAYREFAAAVARELGALSTADAAALEKYTVHCSYVAA